ncbi:sensor histidine kinase [Streptomyces sp. NBC_01320]|uniref:sensor histidine kinase n=1 Tax=Streptomyces sp. NBC_01320 TaxID=2903824 RepID=UPI002E0D90DD|nr:ATP-binding protein [Streptomyces sp. NBC_01320]
MPLRWRLALVFALGTALVIAVAGFLFLQRLTAGLDASLEATLRAQADAEVVRLAARGPLPPLPPPSARDPDGGLGTGAGAERVAQVLAPDGRLLAFTDGAGRRPLADDEQVRAATRSTVGFTTSVEGQEYRMLAVSASNDDKPVVVVVGSSTRLADAATTHSRNALLLGGPPAVVAAGLGAYWLAGSALRPVDRMRRRLTEITEHDTGARLKTPATHDEVATLAATMNDVLDRLADALARQRGFALRAELELAGQPGRTREELAAAVAAAAQDTDRLIRLSEDLLMLSRTDEGRSVVRPERLAPAELLAAAVRAASSRAAPRKVRVRLQADEGVRMVADPDRLRQAVDNLLDNALRYAPDGSDVEVGLTVRGAEMDARAVIEVRDHGPGFPRAFLPLAFERFRRADAARSRHGGGAGLGLAIVRAIAQAHGGSATADNAPGGGARVRLEIPLASGATRL